MTEYKRFELLDGVYLTAVRTDACARGCLSMTFLTQLGRETAAMNAVLPNLLLRGSSRLPDTEAIDAALERMDASVTPVVGKLGELQTIGLRALFPADADAFAPMAQELAAMLLSPNTRGGLLRQDWVKAETEALRARQEAGDPDAAHLAYRRLIEEMCCSEDYPLPALGDAEGAEGIHYQKLTRHYHDLVQASPLEIFYCGRLSPRSAAQALSELLVRMPRGEMDEELGTDVRMNSLAPEARMIAEELPGLEEARLAVGWRLGEQMEDPDLAALRLLAAVFEQMLRGTLDDACRIRFDMHKGLFTLSSPLRQSPETARAVIDAQLELLQTGAPESEALAAALMALEAKLQEAAQDAALLEDYWIERAPLGLLYSPEELIGLLHEVTPADVTNAARGLECDMVYVCTPAQDDESDSLEA